MTRGVGVGGVSRTVAALSLVLSALSALSCSSCKRALEGDNSEVPEPTRLTQVEKPGPSAARELPAAVAGHPRLWVRQRDLPELRSWATPHNPIYTDGLLRAATQAAEDIDQGRVPSAGECAYQGRYCEQHALLMAFMSLLQSEPAQAKAYAERAKKVLLPMLQRVKANQAGDALADPRFSVGDRSRWAGEAFPLTVDWIYAYLSAQDKALIRAVFLRWAEEQLHAQVTDHNHPEPIGKLNDPVLVKDRRARRYAANNYFTAHARNLGLMSLALDAADDPKEEGSGRVYPRLRDYLQNVTGAWLYMSDSVLRNDASGGIAPEGFEYAPRTLAFLLQLYLALETAGEADEARHGSQVLRSKNPFWGELVPAYLNALSPAKVKSQRSGRRVYLPAWTGDGEVYELFDFADSFAPLGISARLRGEKQLWDQTRWIQTHTAAGGSEYLNKRASAEGGSVPYRQAILYFMLFDPKAKPAEDPRPKLAPEHLAAGTGRLAVRESWSEGSAWMNFNCGWAEIDHQHGDAGDFGWYSQGEWLTKERVGYAGVFERSSSHNTLTIANSKPDHADDPRRAGLWRDGSQWALGHTSDPKLWSHVAPTYTAARCSFGGMYNSAYEGVSDVEAAERWLIWFKPGLVVIHDLVRTKRAEQTKRVWFHAPSLPVVHGDRAQYTTPGGQVVTLHALLPEHATLSAAPFTPSGDWQSKPAAGEMMLFDLSTAPASGAPEPSTEARFLHTLEVGSSPAKATRFKQTSGDPLDGVSLGSRALAFLGAGELTHAAFKVPQGTRQVLVVGVTPGSSYAAKLTPGAGELSVEIAPGAGSTADQAGVLSLTAP